MKTNTGNGLKYDYTDIQYCGRNLRTAVIYDDAFRYHKAACHFLFHVAKSSRSNSEATLKARTNDLFKYLCSIRYSQNEYSFFAADYRHINDSQMNAYLRMLYSEGLRTSTML